MELYYDAETYEYQKWKNLFPVEPKMLSELVQITV